MDWTEVEVVDPPAIETLTLTLHPPAYSGLPTMVADGRLPVLAGTQVALAGQVSRPLRSATILLAEGETIACRIIGDKKGEGRSELSLSSEAWKLSTGQRKRGHLQLVGENGLATKVPLPALRVVADQPPVVSWQDTLEDFYVLPTAKIPLSGMLTDDLAIANAHLVMTASKTESETEKTERFSLYQGEAKPPQRPAMPRVGLSLDQREWEYQLDLRSLKGWNLSPGESFTLQVEATDYHGATGRGPNVRRVVVLREVELQSRLAADQAEILRLLEQALADQRTAQRLARQHSIETALKPSASRNTLKGLLTARLTQQKVTHLLTDKREGVVDRVEALLLKITINRSGQPEQVAPLKKVLLQISKLLLGPLPHAEQHLTDLRKQIASLPPGEILPATTQELQQHFQHLEGEQQRVIDTLELLVDEAAAWSDLERFIRELGRLEQEQRQLRETTLAAARRQLAALADSSASAGVTPEELELFMQQQTGLARRFNQITRAMQQKVDQAAKPSEKTKRLEAALAEAQANQLASQLASSAKAIERARLGRATDAQREAADNLRDLLDLLRNRRPTDRAELASRLRKLQGELARLQAEEAELASQPHPTEKQRQQLAASLRQLAKQMKRMTAKAAGMSTDQAAEAINQAEAMKQAEQQMKKAQQQLANRIAELEQERQQRLLERLAKVLDALLPRQQKVLEKTLELEGDLEAGIGSEEAQQQASHWAGIEAVVAKELGEAIEDLDRRAVFQLALQSASRDMLQASAALQENDSGRVTQALELGALTRMRHVRDLLRAIPPPSEKKESDQKGGGGPSGKQPPPPLIELAEVKMLRWLQADLNGRTRRYEADLADSPQDKSGKLQAAQRLAEEQSRLEELVREMMRRNNRTNPAEMQL